MTSRFARHANGGNGSRAMINWFVLVLVVLFASLAFALIVLGAQAYRVIEERAAKNMQIRTAVGYVLNRINTLDGAAELRIDETNFGDETAQALVFGETFDRESYETRLYCADGMLREQFVSAEIPLEHPEDGEGICELNRFLIIMDENMLRFEFVYQDGESDVVHAALRSESGVAL